MRSIFPPITGILIGGFLLFTGVGHVEAAQSVPLSVGTPVTIGSETSLTSPRYSWVLEQEGKLITAQSEKFFSYTFEEEGSYDLSLTLLGANENKEINSFILQVEPSVMLAPTEDTLRAVIRSVPIADQTGRVRLPAVGGVLRLHFDESSGEIAEYRVDADITVDTDGNGTTNDDIDNSLHASLRSGDSFAMSLRPALQEIERRMQLSVVDLQGNVSTAEIVIIFDPTLALTPRLTVFPAGGDDDVIRMNALGGVVRFDATGSYGGVTHYALDLDLEYDSSGDGMPENDNDAAGTLFEQRGSDLTFFLKPHDGKMQRRIALILTSSTGEVRTLERTVIFGADSIGGPSQDSLPSVGLIVADQEKFEVGRTFTLTAEEIPSGTSQYSWDLQNDGLVDTQTSGPSILLEPDTPGNFPVRVTFMGSDGKAIGSATGEWLVHPLGSGAEGATDDLRIDIVSEGLTARFALVMKDEEQFDSLEPTWEFGDGAISYLLKPEHNYEQSGSYDVHVLLKNSETGEVSAEASAKAIVSGTPAPLSQEGGQGVLGSILFIFKVVFFALLILILFTGGAFLFIFVQAKKTQVSVPEMLKSYMGKFTGKSVHDPLAEVVDSKKAEVIDTKEAEPVKSDEPEPMKLQAEEVKEEPSAAEPVSPPPAPPPAPVEPSPPPPPPPSTEPSPPSEDVASPFSNKEEEALPPWLSGDAPSTPPKPSQPPATPAPAPPAPPAPPPTPAPPSPSVPAQTPAPAPPSTPLPTPKKPTPLPTTLASPPAEPPHTATIPTPVPPPPPSDPQAPDWLKGGLKKSQNQEDKKEAPPSDDETIAIVKADGIPSTGKERILPVDKEGKTGIPSHGGEGGSRMGILPIEESKENKENKENDSDNLSDETSHDVS